MMHSQSATNELLATEADAISSEVLGAAMTAATTQLTEFAKSPTALHALDQAFDIANPQAAATLLEDWADGVFGPLPAVEILADATLNGAQGAYSAANNTIYLAESLDSLTGLTEVLLEELGHYIDTQVNPGADSAGDEGAIFAAIAAGIELTDAELASLQAEDDSAEIIVDGAAIVIEQSSSPDFNGDNTLDIVWRNSIGGNPTGDNVVWFMGGSNSTALTSNTLLSPVGDLNWDIKGFADFNGDSSPDILWRNGSTGQNSVWFMTGENNNTFGGAALLDTVGDTNWDIKGVTDFNEDGNPDIVWRNGSTGQNSVWFMTGENNATFGGAALLDTVGDTNWDIKGVADFNKDGNPDIVWRNGSTGQNSVWFMTGENNATFGGAALLDTVGDTNWDIKGVGDFNKNGDPDILWRNGSTGQNSVWFMTGENNATFGGAALLDTVSPSTGWDIKGVVGKIIPVVNEVDLRIQAGSAEVIDANTVRFSGTVQNNGTGSTNVSTAVKYWLDADNDGALDEAVDTPLTPTTPTTVNTLNAGETQLITAEFDYSSWAGGESTIIAKVDADNAVTETNEDNNTSAPSVTIPPQEPDLQIDSLSVPAQVEEDTTFSFSATVTNAGRTSANGSDLTAYASDDSVFGDDVVIGTQTVDPLAFGAEDTVSFTVDPAQSSFNWEQRSEAYTIFFVADSGSVITEADETNNRDNDPVLIVPEGTLSPDLFIPTVSITDDSDVPLVDSDNDGSIEITLDQAVRLAITVENEGQGSTEFQVFSFLSTDDQKSSGDVSVEESFVDVPLKSGETDGVQQEVTFSNQDSDFSSVNFSTITHLVFEVDAVNNLIVPDVNPGNNFLALPVEFA